MDENLTLTPTTRVVGPQAITMAADHRSILCGLCKNPINDHRWIVVPGRRSKACRTIGHYEANNASDCDKAIFAQPAQEFYHPGWATDAPPFVYSAAKHR